MVMVVLPHRGREVFIFHLKWIIGTGVELVVGEAGYVEVGF